MINILASFIIITRMIDPIIPISPDELPQIIQLFKNDQILASESFFDIQIERKRSNPNNINSQDELRHAVQYISKIEDFQRDLIKRIIQVLSGLKMSIKSNENNHSNYQDAVAGFEETNLQLREQISSLEELLEKQQYNNDKLRKQLEQCEEKIEELTRNKEKDHQKKIEQESYSTKVLDTNREFQIKIKTLEEQNSQIIKHLADSKSKMQGIAAETMEKQIKILELDKKLLSIKHKLELEEEKREKVEATLQQKKQVINRMLDEKQQLILLSNKKSEDHDSVRGSFVNSFSINRESLVGIPVPISNELGDGINEMIMDSFRDRYQQIETDNPQQKTEQDMIVEHLPQTPTMNVNLSARLSQSSVQRPRKPTATVKIFEQQPVVKKQRTQPSFFNPYLAHYTLSCQSMKIILAEEGKKECFNVNMESKYKQLLGSKVQVHQWGDWIRKTMLEGRSK